MVDAANLKDTITAMFLVDGAVLCLMFAPTWRAIWKSKTRAADQSLASWLYWTFSVCVGTSYSYFVVKNWAQNVILTGILVCHVATVTLLLVKRYSTRSRA